MDTSPKSVVPMVAETPRKKSGKRYLRGRIREKAVKVVTPRVVLKIPCWIKPNTRKNQHMERLVKCQTSTLKPPSLVSLNNVLYILLHFCVTGFKAYDNSIIGVFLFFPAIKTYVMGKRRKNGIKWLQESNIYVKPASTVFV